MIRDGEPPSTGNALSTYPDLAERASHRAGITLFRLTATEERARLPPQTSTLNRTD